MSGWWMNNELERLWPDSCVLTCICLERLRETSDRVVGVPAECQTGYLLNIRSIPLQPTCSVCIYLFSFLFHCYNKQITKIQKTAWKIMKVLLTKPKTNLKSWNTSKKRTLFMTVHEFNPFIAELFLTICTDLSLHYDFALHSGDVNT
jgi:hypothetical protein